MYGCHECTRWWTTRYARTNHTCHGAEEVWIVYWETMADTSSATVTWERRHTECATEVAAIRTQLALDAEEANTAFGRRRINRHTFAISRRYPREEGAA